MKEEEKDWEGTRQAAAGIIRKRSEAGCLASRQEILQELIGQNLLLAAPEEPELNLETTLEENEDLRELLSPGGNRRYFSVQFLSETYARILLHKEGDPLYLIAEVVRDRSAKYLRPTSLDIFQGPPFGLSHEQIHACLEQITGQAGYEDIAKITTSVGTVFLYSASCLDPAHASLLAEWLDVGQFNNP